MISFAKQCSHADAVKNGKNKAGTQRFKCRDCGKVFCPPRNRLDGSTRLPADKIDSIFAMLFEGCMIRSVERLANVHRDTVCSLVLELGDLCARAFPQLVTDVETERAECDEIWSWAGAKQKTTERLGKDEGYFGDVWIHTAIDPRTKLLLAYHPGKRSDRDTLAFSHKLADAVKGFVQIDTDGLSNYRSALPSAFGMRVHHAAIVKTYGGGDYDHKYSPARITGVEKHARWGNPDTESASTSIVERSNLSIRTHLRRFTRLTIGFSKSRRHHEAMVSIFALWYNFCRPHITLKKRTPAMAAGLADHRWTIRELIQHVSTTP